MSHRSDIRRSLQPADMKQPAGGRHSGSGHGKVDSPIPIALSNDRVGVLLMEANDICQYLKKDYVFKKGDESLADETVNFVKVINCKCNRSCMWPISKLRERLVRMRKLVYAEDSENAGAAAEAILFDGTDTWQPEAVSPSHDISQHASGPSKVTATFGSLSHHSPQTANSSNKKANGSTESSSSFGCPTKLTSKADMNTHLLQTGDSGELAAESQFMPLSPNRQSTGSSDYRDPATDTPLTRSFTSAPRIKEPLRIERPMRQSPKSTGHAQHLKAVHAAASQCAAGTQTERDVVRRSEIDTQTVNMEMATGRVRSTRTNSTQTVEVVSLNVAAMPSGNQLSVARLCKDVTGLMVNRLSVNGNNLGNVEIIDRVLRLCQSIRYGVAVLIKAYLPTAEMMDPVSGSFVDSCKLETVCIQLVLAIELLVTDVDFWCSQQTLSTPTASSFYDTRRNLMQMVKELAKDIAIFWQACDNKVEALIKDTSSKIMNLLLELATESGKLAVVGGTCPQTLTDLKRTSLEQLLLLRTARQDDLLSLEPGIEVKHAFLSGCDIMVDETIQDCLQALEDNEALLQTSAEHCQGSSNNSVKEEILQNVFVVLTRCKILLVHLQQIQVELDSTIKDDTDKPANFYSHYFDRCVSVMSGAHKVTDTITLLTRATEPCHAEIYGDMLRKICRCSEMVQRVVCHMSQTSVSKNSAIGSNMHGSSKRLSLDLSSIASSDDGSPVTLAATSSAVNWSGTSLCDTFALLPPTQAESLRQLTEAVRQATDELCRTVKLTMAQEEVIASASSSLAVGNSAVLNSKRMLPVVPGSSVGSSSILRCHSARGSDRKSSLLSKHISLLNFPLKKCNEI